MLKNLADSGTQVIAVIDESHLNMDAAKTRRLLAEMRAQVPFVTVDISATPTSATTPALRQKNKHHDVVIDFSEVESEGMVRRTALLNDNFEAVQKLYPKENLDIQVLHAAWDKVASLRAGYVAEGSKVEPLLLIQYPDGKDAAVRALVVEAFLATKGLVKNKTYAMYLSEEHSDGLEAIALNDSPFKALIFKQAIATGWDCPRAQVLVQFRDPKSVNFKIQTIGRIMRSPEQRHYATEDLNLAYVFSDLPSASVSVIADDADFKVRDTAVCINKLVYPSNGLRLQSVFQPRKRELHYPDSANLLSCLKSEFERLLSGLILDDPYESTSISILFNAKIEASDLLASNGGEFDGQSSGSGFIDGVLSSELVQAFFDRVLTDNIGAYTSREQTRPRLKNILVNWIRSKQPRWEIEHVQHFVLRHQVQVIESIAAGCAACAVSEDAKAVAAARAKKRETFNWEVPSSVLVTRELVEPSADGNLLVPAYVAIDRSAPEKRFEAWLAEQHNQGEVKWWWKNGERDEKYLGIEYEMDGRIERTYPDYLVLAASGRLWVLEVKDENDMGGAVGGVTQHKALGLAAWAIAHNQRRVDQPALFDCPEVSAGVVVPLKVGNAFAMKIADAKNWTPPTKPNLLGSSGWRDLHLGDGGTPDL
jgi:type III restriction enzyme